jgi:hypothetical protein
MESTERAPDRPPIHWSERRSQFLRQLRWAARVIACDRRERGVLAAAVFEKLSQKVT